MSLHVTRLALPALLALAACGPSQPATSDAGIVTDAPPATDATDVPTPARAPLDGRIFLQQNADGWRLRVAFRETNPASGLRCAVERANGCWIQDCERNTNLFSQDSTAPVSVGTFRVTGGLAAVSSTPESSGYYPPALAMGALWRPGQTALTLRAEGVSGARAFETTRTAPRALTGGSATAVRGSDFVLRWDPSGAQAGEEVGVRGEVTLTTGSETSRNVEFVCFAPRSAGALTVPASLVNRVPTGATAQGALYAVSHEDRMVEGFPTLIEVVDTTSAVAFTF